MKTKIFSYYLQKLAGEEHKLLGVDDDRAALLALVLTKANLFRRFHTGCTTQELCFCNLRYVQELFIYICLNANDSGNKLLSLFDFNQTMIYRGEVCGRPYLEDKDINIFLDKLFPKVHRNEEYVEKSPYALLLPEISELSDSKWREKFVHPSNLCNVNLEVLCPLETGEETALVDAALAELENDTIFFEMLLLTNRCDIHGESRAYQAYFQQIKDFPKAH